MKFEQPKEPAGLSEVIQVSILVTSVIVIFVWAIVSKI